MSIFVVGDVHGHTDQYQKMLRQKYFTERTIQIGDMGIGFKGVGLHKMDDRHKWFRGNHDNPAECYKNPNYMGDYGYLPDDRLFWLAGAFSIDYEWRTPGRTWWANEELSWTELDQAITLYKAMKPEFVLSHDCPEEVSLHMLTSIAPGFRPEKIVKTRTGSALQVMFDYHKPKEWVFGHYHLDKSFEWKTTKFTCVNELSVYELKTT